MNSSILFRNAPEIIVKDVSDIRFPSFDKKNGKTENLVLFIEITDVNGSLWGILFYYNNVFHHCTCRYLLDGAIKGSFVSDEIHSDSFFYKSTPEMLISSLLNVKIAQPDPIQEKPVEQEVSDISEDVSKIVGWLILNINPESLPDELKACRERVLIKYLNKKQ